MLQHSNNFYYYSVCSNENHVELTLSSEDSLSVNFISKSNIAKDREIYFCFYFIRLKKLKEN